MAEWFTKSLANDIARDIAMGGVVTEEHAISHAQYLNLVYSQMGTLYDLLPDTPRPSTSATSTTPTTSHEADGVIGTFHAQPHSVQTSSNNPKSISSNVQNAPSPTPLTGKTSEVNSVQSTPTEKNKSKNGKGKNKEDKNNLQSDTLVLSVVMITTLRIVHDELRLLSSFKGPQNPLLWSYCHNPSLLNNKPNWSFTTNLPPPIHPMS
jgi:hypothetical protein